MSCHAWNKNQSAKHYGNPGSPAELLAYDQSAEVWRDLVTLTSGSQVLRVGALSGDLLAKISGETLALASGTAVRVAQATIISGNVFTVANSAAALPSAPCFRAVLRGHPSNSGDIYVGGSGVVSGYGYPLQKGDSLTLDVDNLNRVVACATVSGDRLSCIILNY